MSDTETASDNLNQVDELTILKQRAKLLGIQFSNNIGVETLREKIRAKQEEGESASEPEAPPVNPLAGETTPNAKPKSLREQLIEENMKLVRLRITNLDPKKKDLPGEIITIANEYLGTVRKFVPFGEVTDNGYHVPWCIYNFLNERRFLNIRVSRRDGREHVETSWAREFSLEVLPQLTPEELNRLATAQMAAGTVSDIEA